MRVSRRCANCEQGWNLIEAFYSLQLLGASPSIDTPSASSWNIAVALSDLGVLAGVCYQKLGIHRTVCTHSRLACQIDRQ
jgi:hypothetical protein